jgi:hypothetical protein
MCRMTERAGSAKTPARPSWAGLYARAGLMLAALLMMQSLVAAGSALTALRCGLTLAGFIAMAQWTRRNRVALDTLDWCDCAGSQVTVRVIRSAHAQSASTRDADSRPSVDVEPVEATLEEVAR